MNLKLQTETKVVTEFKCSHQIRIIDQGYGRVNILAIAANNTDNYSDDSVFVVNGVLCL